MPENATTLISRFEAVSKGAYLDVLLPKSSDFDASALIRDGSPEELARAPSRRNLLFDGQANVILVLRTAADADTVRELLPSLEIVLAAHATDAVPQGGGNAASASGKHDLSSKTVSAAEGADVVGAGDQSYVTWTVAVDLTRPRTRLQRPAIYFTANLSVRQEPSATSKKRVQSYLKPFQPLPRNVLESLNTTSAFRTKEVYLPDDRLIKAAPTPVRKDTNPVRPIRGATKRAFPTMPALYTRMRYDVVADSVIASLHLETSQVSKGAVNVESIEITMSRLEPGSANAEDTEQEVVSSSHVQCLTEETLPLRMETGDETALLYSIPRSVHGAGSAITVRIRATAEQDEGSPTAIDMTWQSEVTAQPSKDEPPYTWSGPPRVASHDARASSETSHAPAAATLPSDTQAGGVTFFFSAPERTNKYDDFHLNVKCINRGIRTRQFILKSAQLKQSSLVVDSQATSDSANLVASIFNAPPPKYQKMTDTICRTPKVKIGPVPPGASFDTMVELRAMVTGVLDLSTLRINDVDTGQFVDVTNLPDIIALEALEGSEPYTVSKFALQLGSRETVKNNSSATVSSSDWDEMYWGTAATPPLR